jgi:hypothetical protein
VTYTYAAAATSTANVGTTHSITPSAAVWSSGNAANYAITYASGTLTITPSAPLDFTVSTNLGANGSINPASQTVTQGNTASFTVTPNSGFIVVASGCGGSLSGNTYTTGPIIASCTVDVSFALRANLMAGWNLLGNSINVPMNVSTVFADSAQVTSVWKWEAATSKWAFYAPTMSASDLVAYAAGKGYDVLTTINGAEGFWVNAKVAFTLPLPDGTAITSSAFADLQSPQINNLAKGWSLIAVGDVPTPRSFVNTIGLVQPVLPNVASTSLTTLWAWDSGLSGWYFYSPDLDNSGGLAAYIASKKYLDFIANNKTLDQTMGFWVNHP